LARFVATVQRKCPKQLLHDFRAANSINEHVHIAYAKFTHFLNVDGPFSNFLDNFFKSWLGQEDAANFEYGSSMFQVTVIIL
jgi:hypothetical protein